MRRLQLLLAFSIGLSAACALVADVVPAPSSVNEPYRLVVVLRFGGAAAFSRLFVDRTRRQVQDQLTIYFGPLATVQVELYDAILARQEEELTRTNDANSGLVTAIKQLGDRSFDQIEAATFIDNKVAAQVILLQIDRASETYQIRSRSWEGSTQQLGLPGPTSISDRQLVGKAVCAAVCEAFSPVAVVHEGGAGAEVSFMGQKWRDQLVRCLRLPCLLQPLQIEKRRDGSIVRVRMTDTVLRIAKDDLRAECFSNRTNPWRTSSRVIGFEAVRIPAMRGTFTLRILDQRTGDPLSACSVYANERGFTSLGDADLIGLADRDGYVISKKPMDRLAFVKISQGSGMDFQFPLVINSDTCEITRSIPRDPAARMKNEFKRHMRSLSGDLAFVRSSREIGIAEINALKIDKRYEEALERTELLATSLKELMQSSSAQTADLKKQAESLKLGGKQFEYIEKHLLSMAVWIEELDGLATKLNGILKDNSERARAKASVELAQAAEQTGDYERAIANYAQALEERADQPQLREKLAELKRIWAIKSPEHKKARQFVYDTWANQDIGHLDDVIPKAKAAIDTLIKVNDYLTAGKFRLLTLEFVEELAALASQLQDAEPAEERAEVDRAKVTIERLSELAKKLDELRPSAGAESENTDETDAASGNDGAKGDTEF